VKSLFADATPGTFYFGVPTLSINQLPLFRWGAFPFLTPGFGSLGAKLLTANCPALRKFFSEALPSDLPVHTLASGIGNRDSNPGREVGQRNRCRDLVDMLPSRPRGTGKPLIQIIFTKKGKLLTGHWIFDDTAFSQSISSDKGNWYAHPLRDP
jgi:hypothetical protein